MEKHVVLLPVESWFVMVPEKTTSQETNQNLCATKTARMFTQPMLEIYADDVKCAHGSTVGQLNDAALFYMQQRGVSREEAKLLLPVCIYQRSHRQDGAGAIARPPASSR